MFGIARLNTLAKAAAVAAESYFILTNTDATFFNNRFSIDVDASKNIFLEGWPSDAEVFKINEAGAYVWQKSFTSLLSQRNILCDASGNAIITGHIATATTSMGLLSLSAASGTQVFATARQPTVANNLSSNSSTGRLVLKDSAGNFYSILPDSTNFRIVITKFNSSGTYVSNLAFTMNANTTLAWTVSSCCMDSSNNLYLFATFSSGGVPDGYIAKINTSTMTLTWTFGNGSNSFAGSAGMAADSAGNIYIRRNRWIQKINSSGTQVWQRQIGVIVGNDDAGGLALDIDSSDNIYVGFIFSNKNFILKVNSSGNVVYSRSFSTNTSSGGNLALLIRNGSMYLATRGQVVSTTTGMVIAKLPIDGTLTGTYNTTLVYEAAAIALTTTGPFVQTSVSNTVTTFTMNAATLTTTISNATRTANTKTAI